MNFDHTTWKNWTFVPIVRGKNAFSTQQQGVKNEFRRLSTSNSFLIFDEITS